MSQYVSHSLKYFGQGLYGTTIAPYIIPTSYRFMRNIAKECDEHPSKNTNPIGDIIGGLSGLATGVVGWLVSIGLYADISLNKEHPHPEILAIPIATNLASGVYEIGRVTYRNAESRLVERRKIEGLEKSIESAQAESLTQ